MQKDLDVIIEQLRIAARNGLLEFPDKTSDVTIQCILADISREAKGLNQANTGFLLANHQETVTPLPYSHSELLEKLRALDRLMSGVPLYRRLRPLLKRKVNPSPYTIDGLTLIKYNSSEFVNAAYLGILRRQAEQTDIDNLTHLIVTGELSKIQCIDILLQSKEHSQKNVGVRGLGRKRFYDKAKRVVFKIPILGYFLRFIKELVLLPRSMKLISRRLALLEYSIEKANKSIARIEYMLGKED